MRRIFELSRYENLKYAEIASHLNISIKTVETQMSRALVRLRKSLSDYLSLYFIVFLFIMHVIIIYETRTLYPYNKNFF